MNDARFVLCCVIGWCLIFNVETSLSRSHLNERNGSVVDVAGDSLRTFLFEPIDGFKIAFNTKEISFRYTPTNITGNSIEGRGKSKRRNIMKRIGSFLMMIPVAMQLMQIPFAIATVKMNLIRSILVAKIALFMIFIRLLFTPKPVEKIVIVKPPKEFHEHYYHHHPYEEAEDNKPGWLGNGPSWLY